MARIQEVSATVNDGFPPEAAAALDQLLQSSTLGGRPRLREFLWYVGQKTLEGRAEDIKEKNIGIEVFGRHADYSAQDDTIVRVTARQLRQKLEEYYREEGREAAWIVEIPRGTYVPTFRPRSLVEACEPQGPQSAEPTDLVPVDTRRTTWTGWAVAGVLAIALVCLLAVRFWPEPAPEPTMLSLLQNVPGQGVSVVCGDGVVQIFKDLTGDAPTVEAYESGAFKNDPALLAAIGTGNPVWAQVKDRQLVATGSIQSLARLVRGGLFGKISVRHPQEIGVRDLVDGSAILLSGPFANPWVQLFEHKLNFRIIQDDQHQAFIANTSPHPGEASEYRNRRLAGKRISYARMAYMPNLSGKGRVLLIGGPSASLMELMGDAVSEPAFLKQIAARLGKENPRDLPYCEFLMEVDEVAGAPVTTRLLAIRELGAP